MPIDTIEADCGNATAPQHTEARPPKSDTDIAVSLVVPCYNEEGAIEDMCNKGCGEQPVRYSRLAKAHAEV